MSLDQYVVQRDKFSIATDGSVGWSLSFPCCSCQHQHKRDTEEPCQTCDHNANSIRDTTWNEDNPKQPTKTGGLRGGWDEEG